MKTIARYIRKIRVEKLFGIFDHNLDFGETPPAIPSLLILYGENGTGKTTLLWLLYHLMSKENGRGHRTFLAKQRFKRLSVVFSDGTELAATRSNPSLGSFVMTIARRNKKIASFSYKVESDGGIKNLANSRAHDKFLSHLPDFNFGFLPHDRLSISAQERDQQSYFDALTLKTALGSNRRSLPIQDSITKAIATAREQAIKASNEGQFTVNAIYTDLVQQIGKLQLRTKKNVDKERETLLARLSHQAAATKKYSQFGLMSDLDVKGLITALEEMPTNRFQLMVQVLEPFLRGNDARLQALEALHIALTTFVENVNALYLNKRITLHLEKGLQIFTAIDEELAPDVLSSGEQELLMLFCEVISALRPETILFIDEPEISLNVSWQRRLLETLLKCASGSSVQFVIATHSIELLARHRENVLRLSNQQAGIAQQTSPELGKDRG